jgi:hypothetical protein
MTVKARLCSRARRRWPWLALLIALLPSLSGAAPPAAAAALSASPPSTSPRDAATLDAAVSDGARRGHLGNGKVRIGRIFFSPAERRHRYADKTPATDAPSTAGTARGERLEINGAVSSSTQGRAVWVNGTAIENSDNFKSAWTEHGGDVWLRDGHRVPRLVRPGQAIDPASGAIDDLLPAGSVARR